MNDEYKIIKYFQTKGDPLVDVDETAPLRPDSEAAYCAVKAEAEKIVLDANAPGLATESIRPRMVWGPDRILIDLLTGLVQAGQFAWIEGGRHTTDVTFVDNCVEGLMLGWQRGRPGQAYFITDQHPVGFREFWETIFEIYGVDKPTAELDAGTAAREIPVPARWFLGQTCTLRTGKATAELGYKPIISQAAGLDAVRNSVTASRA